MTNKKKRRKKKFNWKKSTEKERVTEVRKLMRRGHSNKTAAKTLNTTPGRIAGLRWRKNIPSKNPLPAPFGGWKKSAPKKKASTPPAAATFVAEQATAPEALPVATENLHPERKLPLKLTTDPALACGADTGNGKTCWFIPEPGEKHCRLHKGK